MLSMILSVFGVALFVCGFMAYKKKKEVARVKPEQAKVVMGGALVLLAFSGWMAEPPVTEKPVGSSAAVVESSSDVTSGEAVTEVLMTIPDRKSSVHKYTTGELNGGMAVVVNDTAGYWVKDGKAFAVNGTAKNMSPGIQYSKAILPGSK